MELAGSETYLNEIIERYLSWLNDSRQVPDRDYVNNQAEGLKEALARPTLTEEEYSIKIRELSVRSGCIATEILCVWWSTGKEHLPKLWQNDHRKFGEMLRIAIMNDIVNLYSMADESEGDVDHRQYMAWIERRRQHLGQFQQALEAKTVSSPLKEIK